MNILYIFKIPISVIIFSISDISILKLQKAHWGSTCFVCVTQSYPNMFSNEYLFLVPLVNCRTYLGVIPFNLSRVF